MKKKSKTKIFQIKDTPIREFPPDDKQISGLDRDCFKVYLYGIAGIKKPNDINFNLAVDYLYRILSSFESQVRFFDKEQRKSRKGIANEKRYEQLFKDYKKTFLARIKDYKAIIIEVYNYSEENKLTRSEEFLKYHETFQEWYRFWYLFFTDNAENMLGSADKDYKPVFNYHLNYIKKYIYIKLEPAEAIKYLNDIITAIRIKETSPNPSLPKNHEELISSLKDMITELKEKIESESSISTKHVSVQSTQNQETEIEQERMDRIEELERKLVEITEQQSLRPNEKEVMNTEEIAEYLNLSTSTIYSMTHKRTIPHTRKGNRLFFKISEIKEWLEKGRRKTKGEIYEAADEYLLKKPQKF